MPDGGSSPEGIAPSSAERGLNSEIKNKREAVLDAFNSAWGILNSIPEDNLTPEQKHAKKAIAAAKGKTIDVGKGKYENKFVDPKTRKEFSEQEGIPVEVLIKVTGDRLLSNDITPEERKELFEQFQLLVGNSESYLKIDDRLRDREKWIARVNHEAYLISQDERATGSPRKDYDLAGRLLARRRELILTEEPDQDEDTTSIPSSTETAESEQSIEGNPALPPRTDTPDERSREYTAILARRDVEINAKARQLAEERVHWDLRRGSTWNPLNIGRKIWYRATEEMYRQRYIEQYSEVMRRNNNSNLRLEFVGDAVREVNEQVNQERQTGRDKMTELLTRNQENVRQPDGTNTNDLREGQKVELMREPVRQIVFDQIMKPLVDGTLPLDDMNQIQQRMRDIVSNNLNNQALSQEDRDQMSQFFGMNERGNNAAYFAVENLIQTAETIRSDEQAHNFAVEQLKLYVANTSWAQETDVNYNRFDRLLARAKSTRFGHVLSPAFLGAGASLVTFLAYRGVGRAAAALGVGVGVGSAIAAFRRNQELKSDFAGYVAQRESGAQGVNQAEVDERIRRMDGFKGRLMRTPGMARMMGAYRMSDFEGILQRLDTVTAEQLRNGGGNEVVPDGEVRRSIEALLATGLTTEADQRALIRRIAEINTRLDFATHNKIGVIQYTGKEKIDSERMLLAQDIARARTELRNVLSDADLARLETEMRGQWQTRLTQTREQQERAFRNYRLRNAAGAAVFGGVVGLASGLATQVLSKEISEFAGQHPGNTIVENIRDGKSILEPGHVAEIIDNQQMKELYQHPGTTLEVRPGVFLEHTPGNTYDLIDSQGNHIYDGPMKLSPEGKITFEEPQSSIPQSVKDLFTQEGAEIRTVDVPWNGNELYQHGGIRDFGQDTALRVTIDPAQNRIVEMIDTTTNSVIPAPPMHITPDGQYIIDGGFDKLPDKLKNVFSQTGWSHAKGDGMKTDGFNIDKSRDFFQNFVARGGRLGVTNILDLAIDPNTKDHLGLKDHLLSFTDKAQKLIDQHPAWALTNGGIAVANDGDPTHLSPELQQAIAGMEAHESTEHNLRRFIADIAKGGPKNARDEVVEQGSFTINTHDTHTGFLNQDKNPDGSPANLVYAEFANKYNRIDPFTGQVEVGKMSFTFHPKQSDEIWVNGFLQQDGKIHVNPNFFVNEAHPGNTAVSAENLQKALGEMKKEGWTVEEVKGQYLITPPTATTYTPLSIEAIDPIPKGTELTLPEPQEVPAIPLPWAPRFPLEAFIYPLEKPPFLDNGAYYYTGNSRRLRDRNGFQNSEVAVESDQLDPEIFSRFSKNENLGFQRETVPTAETLDSLRKDIDNSNNIFMVLPYHIGDTIVSTGYAMAVARKLEKLNNKATLHLITPPALVEAFKSFENDKIKIVPGNQEFPRIGINTPHVNSNQKLNGLETSIESIVNNPDYKNVVLLDFESLHNGKVELLRVHNDERKMSLFTGLFETSHAYNNKTDGRKRYQNFASELLGDNDESEGVTFPTIPVPANNEELYHQIVERSGIDESQNQMTVVLESGSAGRQYGLENWIKAVKKIQTKHPNMQVNFVFNPYKKHDDPTRVNTTQLEDLIRRNNILSSHFVTGTIPELLSFFQKQKVILSNDGGVLHLASNVESGPKVVGVYFPNFAQNWVSNMDSTIGLEAPPGMRDYASEWGETDDSIKWINKITPDSVASAALDILEENLHLSDIIPPPPTLIPLEPETPSPASRLENLRSRLSGLRSSMSALPSSATISSGLTTIGSLLDRLDSAYAGAENVAFETGRTGASLAGRGAAAGVRGAAEAIDRAIPLAESGLNAAGNAAASGIRTVADRFDSAIPVIQTNTGRASRFANRGLNAAANSIDSAIPRLANGAQRAGAVAGNAARRSTELAGQGLDAYDNANESIFGPVVDAAPGVAGAIGRGIQVGARGAGNALEAAIPPLVSAAGRGLDAYDDANEAVLGPIIDRGAQVVENARNINPQLLAEAIRTQVSALRSQLPSLTPEQRTQIEQFLNQLEDSIQLSVERDLPRLRQLGQNLQSRATRTLGRLGRLRRNRDTNNPVDATPPTDSVDNDGMPLSQIFDNIGNGRSQRIGEISRQLTAMSLNQIPFDPIERDRMLSEYEHLTGREFNYNRDVDETLPRR